LILTTISSLYTKISPFTDGSTLVQEVNHESSTTEVQLDVAANQVYYWKVVAIDANGNKSSSGVSFRTQ